MLSALAGCVDERQVLPDDVLSQAQVASFENRPIRVWGDVSENELKQANLGAATGPVAAAS